MRIQLFGAGHLTGPDGKSIDLDPNKAAILVDTTSEGDMKTQTLQPDLVSGIDTGWVQVLAGSGDRGAGFSKVFSVVNRQTLALLDEVKSSEEQKLGTEAVCILEYLSSDEVSPPLPECTDQIAQLPFSFEEVNSLVDAITKLRDGVKREEVCKQLGLNKIIQDEVLNLICNEASGEDPVGDFVRWAIVVNHPSMQSFVEGLIEDETIRMIIAPHRRWT